MTDFSAMTWLNPPSTWRIEGGMLHVTTDSKTDFWRETHYGFVRDTGHFLHTKISGDFSAELTFSADYTHLYDQAGIMLRFDNTHWLKAGVEYSDGERLLSTVVTRERSDWSVSKVAASKVDVSLRLTREGGAVLVQFLVDGGYHLLRLTDFTTEPILVGPMCCTPEREGLEVTFKDFKLGAPSGELHELG